MKQDFRCGCWLMEKREAAMKAITRNLDRGIWRDLMKRSGMLSIMDAQARDQWYNSLEKDDIPAVSEENILSTFEQLHLNKGEVFERGVINVFKGLSWDYRTNSPCKFGTKIIVTGLVKYDRWGFGLNWGWQRDRLADLERMVMILDVKPVPTMALMLPVAWETISMLIGTAPATRMRCLRLNISRRVRHISLLSDRN